MFEISSQQRNGAAGEGPFCMYVGPEATSCFMQLSLQNESRGLSSQASSCCSAQLSMGTFWMPSYPSTHPCWFPLVSPPLQISPKHRLRINEILQVVIRSASSIDYRLAHVIIKLAAEDMLRTTVSATMTQQRQTVQPPSQLTDGAEKGYPPVNLIGV